nr:uncharacterized protein LOC110365253 isoform X9 [Columba livia]XP_021155129.1 uncharacterized protein LOC110365253 isoform X9 [Columba livia]XP_021155130.1 uncharacterized protein LOC110365253 isoform X9 [Columba livia]
MGLSLQRLAQLCAMSESTETRVISNVNCRLLNYFKPSYDSKSSMILKEMGRVFTNWFCPPPAYEEELSDTRAEVQHALSSPDAGGRSRLLVSNRRLLQHSGTSRSGHCWAPEEFGTGHAPPAGSSQHPAALSSSELPCSRRSRAPGPELQDGIAQSNETRSVPCHRQKGDGVAAVTEEDRQYLKNQQLQSHRSSGQTKGCCSFLRKPRLMKLCIHLHWACVTEAQTRALPRAAVPRVPRGAAQAAQPLPQAQLSERGAQHPPPPAQHRTPLLAASQLPLLLYQGLFSVP